MSDLKITMSNGSEIIVGPATIDQLREHTQNDLGVTINGLVTITMGNGTVHLNPSQIAFVEEIDSPPDS